MGGRNLYLDPSTRAALIPSADLAISIFDTLSDAQIDHILAGDVKPPKRHGWRAKSVVQPGRQIRCSLCGRQGHNRVACGG